MQGFISQEEFNDIVRFGTVQDVHTAALMHRELIVGIDEMGKAPLMYAADRSDFNRNTLVDVVHTLISMGARMDAGIFFGTTPLCYAATKHHSVLQVFIDQETNWMQYNDFMLKPWQIALRTSKENFWVILPHVPPRALFTLNQRGHTLLIEVIQERPELVPDVLKNAHMRNMVNVPGENGETALAHAARLGVWRRLVVRALVRAGARLLYYKNGKAIFHPGYTTGASLGVQYMRSRIRDLKRADEFDPRYNDWYECDAI